jgi:hypothetical protein
MCVNGRTFDRCTARFCFILVYCNHARLPYLLPCPCRRPTHTQPFFNNSKTAASFQSMEVRNENFAAYIDYFTTNTYVMVIMSDASIPSAATLLNIHNARKHFERLEGVQ